MNKKLPEGCCYPDCFRCVFDDCIVDDIQEQISIVDLLLEIDALERQRAELFHNLQLRKQTTKDSKEYHRVSTKLATMKKIYLERTKTPQKPI